MVWRLALFLCSNFYNMMQRLNPSTSSELNNVLLEIFLQGPEDKVTEVLSGQVSVIIQHQSGNNDDFFMGICTGNIWDNSKVICSVQIAKEPARKATVLAMVPKNNSGIRGYAVVDFSLPDTSGNYPNYDIFVKGVFLNRHIQEVKNWPVIYTWLQTDGIYCSSSRGNDNWPGTEEYPVATIDRAIQKGKRVLLRCGDVYYENLELSDVVIGSYGSGAKPQISGLRKINKNSWQRGMVKADGKWEASSAGNVWRLDLENANLFEGFETAVNSYYNNIGTVINLDSGLPADCLRYDEIIQLTENYDYALLSSDGKFDILKPKYLYLRLNVNPNNLNLGVTAGVTGISMTGSELSGSDVRYWGIHGIAAGSNSKIENCVVCAIGGSSSEPKNGTKTIMCSYGNGIEVWFKHGTVTENIIVSGCKVSHCYDAGITMQGRYNPVSDPIHNAKNIQFSNNRVSHCGYGFEVFNSPDPKTDPTTRMLNCLVSRCTFVSNGINTGFRYQRVYRADEPLRNIVGNGHLRFWNDYPIGCVVEDCTFIDGNYLSVRLDVQDTEPTLTAPFRSVVLRRNFILLLPNQYLMSTTPDKDIKYYKWVPKSAKEAKDIYAKYAGLTQDNTSILQFDYTNTADYITPVIVKPLK